MTLGAKEAGEKEAREEQIPLDTRLRGWTATARDRPVVQRLSLFLVGYGSGKHAASFSTGCASATLIRRRWRR